MTNARTIATSMTAAIRAAYPESKVTGTGVEVSITGKTLSTRVSTSEPLTPDYRESEQAQELRGGHIPATAQLACVSMLEALGRCGLEGRSVRVADKGPNGRTFISGVSGTAYLTYKCEGTTLATRLRLTTYAELMEDCRGAAEAAADYIASLPLPARPFPHLGAPS